MGMTVDMHLSAEPLSVGGFLSQKAPTLLAAAVLVSTPLSCYSGGGRGQPPPSNTFYFPTGLAVSSDQILYAANSDFDLKWNGGTLQSYDLRQLRIDVARLIQANSSGETSPPSIPFIDPTQWHPNCQLSPPSGGLPLGEACSPPVDSAAYFKHSVTIGAFATDLQLSLAGGASGTARRLFAPVGGDESLTWADVGVAADPNDPFAISCGQDSEGRCDANHRVGNDPTQAGDTRQVTMPDGPFGMAQTEDGTAIALTHQTAAAISLATTGLGAPSLDVPALKYVLSGMQVGLTFVTPPTGGSGIAAVPHDPDGPEKPCEQVADAPPCLRPAFLETFHSIAEVDLLRFYDDDGTQAHQPFLQREGIFNLTANAGGTDSRGIVTDPTPSIACKAQGLLDPASCAMQYPPRVFFSTRTPPALTVGHIGDFQINDGTFNPDQLVITRNVPLPPGPSNVYLAPIVNQAGAFELRVFVVLFDSSQIAVYDPNAADESAVTLINVGPGPFAMAFDAFSFDDVARQAMVGPPTDGNRPYRFAYVGSFTQSFVQVIDLDNSQPTAETFEHVVFTLGLPTLPTGQQTQQQSPGFL